MKNPAKALGKYIANYGRTVTLSADGKTYSAPYRAFIQPLRYKNKMYLMGIRSKIGRIDQSHFLYIGPCEVGLTDVSAASRIKCGTDKYYIVKAETVWNGDKPFYNWAVIRTVIGEEVGQNG